MARSQNQTPEVVEETTVEVPPTTDVTVDGEEYHSRGQTILATSSQYEFRAEGFPPITSAGIRVSKDNAEVLLALASKYGVTLSVTHIEKEN